MIACRVVLILYSGVSAATSLASPTRVVSTNKNGGQTQTYTFHDADSQYSVLFTYPIQDRRGLQSVLTNLQGGLRSTFLPSGYPTRTPPGYLRYSMWSWIQDLSTQLRGVLATQRVLEGVGVGRQGATALSALLNFLVRDGAGMAATLLFTSLAGARFAPDIKRWRLFADIMVDVGITLEVAATHVPPQFFLTMISVGNMCKAICGVAAGACGGAINLHWAKGSDISDINAKFGAQHTVTASLGLIFAALFAKSVADLPAVPLWLLYSSLTLLHIVANVRCMRLVTFDTFNTVRLNIVLSRFMAQWQADNNVPAPPRTVTVPTPQQVSALEPVFFRPGSSQRLGSVPIVYGTSFNDLIYAANATNAPVIGARLQSGSAHVVAIGHATAAVPPQQSRQRPRVYVAVRQGATPLDQVKAYVHAQLLASLIVSTGGSGKGTNTAQNEADQQLKGLWSTFVDSCQHAGWSFTACSLRSRGFEVQVT